MTSLITADIHMTDKPADAYRWPLFAWLKRQAKGHDVDEILILGDLTDAKDHHSSYLVNRLFDELVNLGTKIIILKGNHDFIDPDNPFFRFVDNDPNIEYVSNTKIIELSIGKATFVPAGVRWNFKVHDFPYLFTHVTFDGSEAANGRLLPGVSPTLLKDYQGICVSGDIHVPQKIGKNIIYVGAPYHCRFGDSFEPRVLLIHNDGKMQDLHFPSPKKRVIDINELSELKKYQFPSGDQVKIRCHLQRSEYDKWREIKDGIRKMVSSNGWQLSGPELLSIVAEQTDKSNERQSDHLTAEQLVEAYGKKHKANKQSVEMAKSLLGESNVIR